MCESKLTPHENFPVAEAVYPPSATTPPFVVFAVGRRGARAGDSGDGLRVQGRPRARQAAVERERHVAGEARSAAAVDGGRVVRRSTAPGRRIGRCRPRRTHPAGTWRYSHSCPCRAIRSGCRCSGSRSRRRHRPVDALGVGVREQRVQVGADVSAGKEPPFPLRDGSPGRRS